MRQTGAAEGWGGGGGGWWEVGVAVYWPRVALIWGEGANLRIYTYNLHLPIKGFSLRSNT